MAALQQELLAVKVITIYFRILVIMIQNRPNCLPGCSTILQWNYNYIMIQLVFRLRTAVKITIPAGAWFRIDSSKRPSTNFYAWDMTNPDQTYNGAPFDINYPIEDPKNRILEKD